MVFLLFDANYGFQSSEVGPQIDRIYEKLGETLGDPTSSNDTGAVIGHALEALRLISNLSEEKVASKSYDLFRMVMGAPAPETRSQEGWEVSRLTIYCAYKGDKFIPLAEDEDIQYILAFLDYYFELAGLGQNQDEPIQNALHALTCTPDSTIAALERFDLADSLVRNIQYAFQDDRPPNLRKTVLLFLALICGRWFRTDLLTTSPERMKRFCVDWASAVDCVEQTPAIKTATLAVLLEMIDSPHWRPHIVPEKFALLEDLKLVPDDFKPLRSCINDPDLMDTIKNVENPMAIVHWVMILWSRYAELGREVREQLEAVTKEIVRKEQRPGCDASRSLVGECLSEMASELRKAKDELKRYPAWPPYPVADPLEEKVRGLESAIGTLDAIRQGKTATGAET